MGRTAWRYFWYTIDGFARLTVPGARSGSIFESKRMTTIIRHAIGLPRAFSMPRNSISCYHPVDFTRRQFMRVGEREQEVRGPKTLLCSHPDRISRHVR